MKSVQKQIEALKRGVIDLISEKELSDKLEKFTQEKKPLRVKLGVDPTAPDIHLGHTVVLQKLRQFQDLGHIGVLIIGDYTAIVGDPSGTQKTRPQLFESDIQLNAKTYFEQVQKILNMKRTEIRYNSEWFKKMLFSEVIQLASRMTVARMLERDDFSKRFKKGTPICIHEFIYPLMQGYDSLMVKADVELGGTDQLFNLLVGRQLQKEQGQEPQTILTTPLLPGTDGVQKMSKSLKNSIDVSGPPREMYGKIMSISDDLMWNYYELLSRVPQAKILENQEKVSDGKLNPKTVKMELAFELVERFYSREKAQFAADEFSNIFSSKKMPSSLESVVITIKQEKIMVAKLIMLAQCASSHTEAKRLIKQGAVTIEGQKIQDVNHEIPTKDQIVIKVGKRRFKKVIFKSP